MKNLPDEVKEKSIEIANALLKEKNMEIAIVFSFYMLMYLDKYYAHFQ